MNSDDLQMPIWEPVIGLEIHVELNTKSKLFSWAPNQFGSDPNTNITPVCTGQPGSLPVLNKEAVKKAVQFGCAINAEVCQFSKFDRKSYFYPDSPRNFQITQFDQPIIKGGKVVVAVDEEEKSFAINRVHLEDDAGMLKHFPSFAAVDYNRAGVPLIEIVSEPCIHQPHHAVAFAMAIKAILQYIDASDCNMEEGSLRIDANISVRKKGETTLRNKIEIKNMNSFNFLEMALESEIRRQIKEYTKNTHLPFDQVIKQSTYRWDPEKKETVLMRRKETADDYRYFPEPDLVPIVLSAQYIDDIRNALPELPLQRERRYMQQFGMSPHFAFLMTAEKKMADYFEETLKTCNNPKAVCNWMLVEFAGRLKETGQSIVDIGISPRNLGQLVNMIDKGIITGKIAKSVADDMVLNPSKDCEAIVSENPDYKPLSDQAELEKLVDQIVAENQQSVADYLSGKAKAYGFLVGQVMKLSRGTASPKLVNDLLQKKLGVKESL